MRAYPRFRVFIKRLDGQIEPFRIPLLCVADPPTLDDLRARLEDSPLGDVEKDIFFPNWTKSLHVVQTMLLSGENVPSWDTIEANKQTIDTPEKLRSILDNEEASPGTTAIIVQQCRSKRYSRKKDESNTSSDSTTKPSTDVVKRNNSSPRQRNLSTLNANNSLTYALPVNCISDLAYENRPMFYMDQPYYHAVGMLPQPHPAPVYQPCYTYAPFNVSACYNYITAPSFVQPPYQTFHTY